VLSVRTRARTRVTRRAVGEGKPARGSCAVVRLEWWLRSAEQALSGCVCAASGNAAWRCEMRLSQWLWSFGGEPGQLLVVLLAAGSLVAIGAGAAVAPASAAPSGTVLQTDLVSDLPGVAAVTDSNLVNPWGISESGGSPFWVSDNGAGLSTLYLVPGANNAQVSINPLAVNIPSPTGPTGGTPTGTVFNTGSGGGA